MIAVGVNASVRVAVGMLVGVDVAIGVGSVGVSVVWSVTVIPVIESGVEVSSAPMFEVLLQAVSKNRSGKMIPRIHFFTSHLQEE
jgi:hypothetical protein